MGDNEKAAWQEGGGVRKNDRRMVKVIALAGCILYKKMENTIIMITSPF
jgi:hypothetical protein